MTYTSVADPIGLAPIFPGERGADAADAGRLRGHLRDLVTRHVVPTLAANRRHLTASETSRRSVAALAALLLASPFSVAAGAVEALVRDGVMFDEVMLLLLAPVARHLGDLWLSDRSSFLEVTRGSAVLQALVRQFGPEFEARGTGERHGRAVLLTPVPGEQHVLGLCMLASLFRRHGWHVAFQPGADKAAILARLATEPFDLVGISASGTRFADEVPAFASEVRAASRHAGLRILAGGELLTERQAAGAGLGVDGVARDAREAVRLADRLVPAAARPV